MSAIFPVISDDGLLEYLPVTATNLEGAIDVIRKSFFIDEAVCKAVEVSTNPEAAKELEELCYANAKDGVSLLAVERSTGRAVGALFNKLQVKNDVEDTFFFNVCGKL
uniref:Uncharacterized protein n=1 Tax=Photinus pyralis TaxID=7054 RepID=A0A1Y1MTN5_PHOPY